MVIKEIKIKIRQPFIRIDNFTRDYRIEGYSLKRHPEAGRVVYEIDWTGLMLGGIIIREVDDKLSSIALRITPMLLTEELPTIQKMPILGEENQFIHHDVEQITWMLRSSEYKEKHQENIIARAESICKWLSPLKEFSAKLFWDKYLEQLYLEFNIDQVNTEIVTEANPNVIDTAPQDKSLENNRYPKSGRPGLDPIELKYRLDKAREAVQVRKDHPDKVWKEIASIIDWKYPGKSGLKLLHDAIGRLKRLERNPDNPDNP